jgi:uncharacterized protein (TIGR02453 family)
VASDFKGFSKDFFSFFIELAENNNREWFNANKARYTDIVQDEMVEFIIAIAPHLEKISTHYIANPKRHGGSMFRIYKDVRFAKDKRPYKDHAACQFRHNAAEEIIFGGGIWKPPSDKLKLVRERIAERPVDWKKVTSNKRLKDTFGGVAGDGLVRPPKGFDPKHKYIDDLKRQSYFAMRRTKPSSARSKNFVDEVAQTFKAASPLMKFLNDALGQPY